MENILYEPIQTHSYYNEYLNTIKRYENVTRSSIFIRYYNINLGVSTINEDTKGTFDKFESGIYFDSYDYTPAVQFDVNINSASEKNDQSGFKFDGATEVVVYTIPEPKMGDIIIFPYAPYQSEEIFRVNSISSVLGVRNSNILSYKLGLEYAPLKTIANLKISNQYAYLISKEKNIALTEYIEFVKRIQRLSDLLITLQPFFNDKYELYFYQFGQYTICPININRLIYNYLCNEKLNDRYFDSYKKPFGVNSFPDDSGIELSTGKIVKISQDGIPLVDDNNELITSYLNPSRPISYVNQDPLNINMINLFSEFRDYAIR